MKSSRVWRSARSVSATLAAFVSLSLSLSLAGGRARASTPPDEDPSHIVGEFWDLVQEQVDRCDALAKRRQVFGEVRIEFTGAKRFTMRASKNLSPDLIACVARAARSVLHAGEELPWSLRDASRYGFDLSQQSFTLGERRAVLPEAARLADAWRLLADVDAPPAQRAKARRDVRRLVPADVTIGETGCLHSRFDVFQTGMQAWLETSAKQLPWPSQRFFPSALPWLLTRELLVTAGEGGVYCPVPLSPRIKRELRAKLDAVGSCWQGEVVDLLQEARARLPRDRGYRWAAVAGTRACAVDEAGAIVCCGSPIPARPPQGRFTRIDMIAPYSCALREDQTAVCWPEPGSGSTLPRLPTLPGRYTELTLAAYGACGKRVDGRYDCSGSPLPPDELRQSARELVLDPSGFSILRADGALVSGTYGAEIHEGPRDLLAVRPPCILTHAGEVLCRGTQEYQDWGLATRERFHDIAVNGSTGCGRHLDDTLECWGGSTSQSPLKVPTGQFRQIAGGSGQVCGVRVDGTLACGGYRSDWIIFE